MKYNPSKKCNFIKKCNLIMKCNLIKKCNLIMKCNPSKKYRCMIYFLLIVLKISLINISITFLIFRCLSNIDV